MKIQFAFAVALVACGSPSRSIEPPKPVAGERIVPPARAGMKLELAPIVVRGSLEVRTLADGPWLPLAAGNTMKDVLEVRAIRRGAIVALGHGDAAGRLWLRANTTVRLGQDDAGVHVEVLAGRARLRRPASALPASIDTTGGVLEATGDYVMQALAAGGTVAEPVGAHPELAAFSLELEADETGAGIGKMEMPGATTGSSKTDAAAEKLALRRVIVDVKTAGDFAVTEVEHVFASTAERDREGTFRFPVPDGALLTGMAMEVNGKLIEGEIVEREKARATYEKIVDEMQDPALLEWEEGNWFKLRVFPIQKGVDKRVIIRYASPLVRGASGYEYNFALAAPELPIHDLVVRLDGRAVATEKQVTAGMDLAVAVGDDKVPAVMREVRPDGVYTAVRIPAPDHMTAAPAGPRKVAVIVDSSRSALEGKPLELAVVKAALAELTAKDSFVVLAADVAVQPSSSELASATPEEIEKATRFLSGLEFDGASDVGAALTAAAGYKPTDVIYIGDGIATWGQREPAQIAAIADGVRAPIYAGLVGKGASTELWNDVAGRTGGRAVVVRREIDARRFALAAVHASSTPRLAGARVEVTAGSSGSKIDAVVYPAHAQTLYAGDSLLALIKTPAGQLPSSVTLTGTSGGVAVKQTIALATPVKTERVMQRWAAQHLAALDADGAPREDIVALSRDANLVSRYTSLLVLENDEAYKRYEIERRNAALDQQIASTPRITGGDLDSLGAARPSLGPDEIQPGDPEIKIPAPRDARSVVVTFPFGETKVAEWDHEENAWMVRFLVDKDTPDGSYEVRVVVTHADGRSELIKLWYEVDTSAPTLKLTATRTATGYLIRATQTDRKKDAARVEVTLPDDTVLVLKSVADGRFEGTWQTEPLLAPVTLRVVAGDRAHNPAVTELVVGAN